MTETEYVISTAQRYWSAVAYDHHNDRSVWEWAQLASRLIAVFAFYSIVAIVTVVAVSGLTIPPLLEGGGLKDGAAHLAMTMVEGTAAFLVSCIAVILGKLLIRLAEQQYNTEVVSSD